MHVLRADLDHIGQSHENAYNVWRVQFQLTAGWCSLDRKRCERHCWACEQHCINVHKDEIKSVFDNTMWMQFVCCPAEISWILPTPLYKKKQKKKKTQKNEIRHVQTQQTSYNALLQVQISSSSYRAAGRMNGFSGHAVWWLSRFRLSQSAWEQWILAQLCFHLSWAWQ